MINKSKKATCAGSLFHSAAMLSLGAVLAGCAVQAVQPVQREAPQSAKAQKDAQLAVAAQTPAAPLLKRKIALGRVTNETNYGQSLLRDRSDDPLGKQVTDLLSKALTESGAYVVFERPDIGRIQAESRLTDSKLNLIGVDALIIGSLTEFGRKTIGETGFVSSSKRQVAFAKMDVRVVDVNNGNVFFATSGAGEASTESASTFGFGSQASYDGTLNDAAIRLAVSETVSRLSTQMQSRPWQTYILKTNGNQIFMGGGKSQGVKPGMEFAVFTAGEQIKSPQTGALITLPGQSIARLKVETLFGEGDLNEGAIGSLTAGSIAGQKIEQLVIRYEGAK